MADVIQRSFAGGEVAPALYGRADILKYQTGLRVCRNFFVRRYGGVSNRTGSQYITPQKTHTARGRLIKFVFNADQTYVLLFENNIMRVVQHGILLTVPAATAWSAATNYVAGDVAKQAGVNYYCILAHINQVPPNATYWYAMPAGNIYEVPTPFLTADLQKLYRSQSGDVITLTHPGYRIYDLSRTGHTTWVFTIVDMEPSIIAPPTLTNSGAAGTVTQWVATAVKEESYEESEPSASTGSSAVPSSGSPITLTIGTVVDALEYNVYKNEGNGVYGFIGVSKLGTFIDSGMIPDYGLTPPEPRDPFVAVNSRPACSGYLQQRKCYGGLLNDPETVFGSKTGQYTNFGTSSPLQRNDAVRYSIASREVNTIRHLLEVMETFILTQGVEWVAEGDADGQLTPGSPGLKPRSFYGSSEVPPVIIGDTIIFVQTQGKIVRDLNYEAKTTSYLGRELSVFAPHLFVNTTIEHMDFAQVPDSIVWVQQDDGALVGLTYLREHEVWGWHRHDTDGFYEDVVSISESGIDVVYVLVRRTIGGVTKRYLERFASREVTDVAVDAIFLDSYLTYDGRNVSGTTMTLSGGTDWLVTEDLILTASAAFFSVDEIGNAIRLSIETTGYTAEGGLVTTVEHVILNIVDYTDPTIVTVNPSQTVPDAFRHVAFTNWARGVDEIGGLEHLEGKVIAALGDGHVITNGIDVPLTTVTAGRAAVGRPYFVIHAGLPYVSDLETLNLEIVDGETITSKVKAINQVEVHIEASRGFWAGPDFTHLKEVKQRTPADAYGVIPLATGQYTVSIPASWKKNGHVAIRQRDPLPLTVLNLTPSVQIGG